MPLSLANNLIFSIAESASNGGRCSAITLPRLARFSLIVLRTNESSDIGRRTSGFGFALGVKVRAAVRVVTKVCPHSISVHA
jgi:hypothetical protein